jgi:hypothetical protein
MKPKLIIQIDMTTSWVNYSTVLIWRILENKYNIFAVKFDLNSYNNLVKLSKLELSLTSVVQKLIEICKTCKRNILSYIKLNLYQDLTLKPPSIVYHYKYSDKFRIYIEHGVKLKL